MIIPEQTLFALIKESCIEKYKQDYKIYLESILCYIAETEIGRGFISEAEDFLAESGEQHADIYLQEYITSDTPLSLIPDENLLEAVLEMFYEKVYEKDKDGKTITGRHKGTNRYTGSRRERLAKATKAFYDKGDNREKHNADMRRRYRIKAGTKKKEQEASNQQKDAARAKKEGISLAAAAAKRKEETKPRRRFHRKNRAKKPEAPELKAKRIAKELDNTGGVSMDDKYARDPRLEGIPRHMRAQAIEILKKHDASRK